MFCSIVPKEDHVARVSGLLSFIPDIDMAITDNGRRLMQAKYLQRDEETGQVNETVSQRLAHACAAYADDFAHAERLAGYIKKGWFMFATPVLSNAGTSRGLPISCFLNTVEDSINGILDTYAENGYYSAFGGGIGTTWSQVRSRGTRTSKGSQTTGVIPFMKVTDSMTTAFQQGITRKGAAAVYLSVQHPEILEFLEIRNPIGGDVNRRCLNTHYGVVLCDGFMTAVHRDGDWNLVDPHTLEVTDTVPARLIMRKIIEKRMTTGRGEPYIYWEDTAREYSQYAVMPEGVDIYGSNLCTEITLATGPDYSAVCCLSSVNLLHYYAWKYNPLFIEDLVHMLDNALEVFIRQSPDSMYAARISASHERSIGLGAMGLHSYLQDMEETYGYIGDVQAFKDIQKKALKASEKLGKEKWCPPATDSFEVPRRNTHITAVAPNASSSLMLGVSPGIEPYRNNIYTITQGEVMFEVRNPELEDLLNSVYNVDAKEVWESIRQHDGSVQHLSFLTEEEKLIFRTFEEIDQRELVYAASLRQPYIHQAQSFNVCFSADADPKYVYETHMLAWEGVEGGQPLKSMYYIRKDIETTVESTSTQAVREAPSCPIDAGEDCSACD